MSITPRQSRRLKKKLRKNSRTEVCVRTPRQIRWAKIIENRRARNRGEDVDILFLGRPE